MIIHHGQRIEVIPGSSLYTVNGLGRYALNDALAVAELNSNVKIGQSFRI